MLQQMMKQLKTVSNFYDFNNKLLFILIANFYVFFFLDDPENGEANQQCESVVNASDGM